MNAQANDRGEVLAYIEDRYFRGPMKSHPVFVRICKERPNMRIDWTGGNCRALAHPLDDGGYVWITDDAGLPDRETKTVAMGVYSRFGDPVESEQWDSIPVGRARAKLASVLAAHMRPTAEGSPARYWNDVTINALVKAWEDWCEEQRLPLMSADDLLAFYSEKMSETQLEAVKTFVAELEKVA